MAAGFLGLGSTLIKNVVTVIIKGGLHRLSILLTLPFIRPVIQNFKIPPPRANTWHLTITCTPGSREFDAKGIPEGRKFDLFQGGVGNLN